ncbi:Aldo/keto reductase [Hymenopellis radicata]|nr:Aldo/keto reductase [Hymenopellis radicata]
MATEPFYKPLDPPPSKLGVYRALSPLSGLHVSPLALGAMSIGDKWQKFGFGSMDKEASFKLLDAYFDKGGNFIDTANSYQDGTSEEFIGEWQEKRGIRDQLVIATKYSINYKWRDPSIKQTINFVGNSSKSMHVSVRDSLRKLRTDYVDILYVHWWDFETPIEEVMNSLHHLVTQGKVLYLGISDAPAWVVSRANMYAQAYAKTPFVIYQGHWNIMDRAFEREIIPMARTLGLALAPWDVLASGKFRTDSEEEERKASGEKGRALAGQTWERTEDEVKISKALEKVGAEVGTKNIRAVALAYVMQKTPYVFPLVGGRKVEHLVSNIEALDITLSAEQIAYIESVLPFDVGFPGNFVGDGSGPSIFITSSVHTVRHSLVQPIRP